MHQTNAYLQAYIIYHSIKIFIKIFIVGSVVKWLKRRARDQHGLGQNPLAPFCCVLGKDTLWHFPLLGGLSKQFYIKVISLLNYKRTAIFWHLRKQVGVIAYVVLAPILLCISASVAFLRVRKINIEIKYKK